MMRGEGRVVVNLFRDVSPYIMEGTAIKELG